jgi:hypothetical protein
MPDPEPSTQPPERAITPLPGLPALGPVLSRLSGRARPSSPPLNDGFDNYPPPLPSDPVRAVLHVLLLQI